MRLKFVIFFCFLLAGLAGRAQTIQRIRVTDLEKMIAENRKPMIINFWASWCVPCIEEIPYFQQEVAAHTADSLQLLLVSLDMADMYPAKLASFAKRRKFTAPILWLDETNADYFCPRVDPKWSGVIPASLFLNPAMGYRKFVEEQLSHAELKKEIMAILGKGN